MKQRMVSTVCGTGALLAMTTMLAASATTLNVTATTIGHQFYPSSRSTVDFVLGAYRGAAAAPTFSAVLSDEDTFQLTVSAPEGQEFLVQSAPGSTGLVLSFGMPLSIWIASGWNGGLRDPMPTTVSIGGLVGPPWADDTTGVTVDQEGRAVVTEGSLWWWGAPVLRFRSITIFADLASLGGRHYSAGTFVPDLAVAIAIQNVLADGTTSDPGPAVSLVPATPVPLLGTLTLKKSISAGCTTNVGTVTLNVPAPTAGSVVSLSDTLVSATVPSSLTFVSGQTTKSFVIKTTPVAAVESGTVTVSLGSESVSQPLTVRPMGLSAVKLSPSTVVGGHDTTGTATLECVAGPGPVTVDLSTSNAAVASPVAPTVIVPQGLKSQTFTVGTNPVLSRSSAMITGEASATTKSRRLTVVPAAEVSTTSIRFGSIPVGQSSASLTAVLRNNGVAPFAVNGISLTGTGASWFAQTNNCPASLAPGSTCAISVTFTSLAAASKSAKLSIATSATATPLSVSLSGTGI